MKFEYGVWFLYFRSQDSREMFNTQLALSRILKYQVDVSILAKQRLVASLTELSSCSGRSPFGLGSVDVAEHGTREYGAAESQLVVNGHPQIELKDVNCRNASPTPGFHIL